MERVKREREREKFYVMSYFESSKDCVRERERDFV